jgi:hypothetical protein
MREREREGERERESAAPESGGLSPDVSFPPFCSLPTPPHPTPPPTHTGVGGRARYNMSN